MMLALREPVRIIAKNTTLSLSAAAMLLGILSEQEIRCAVRTVPSYTQNELDALLHEEYHSFIFLDCDEAIYRSRLESRTAYFLNAADAYNDIDFEKAQFAHLGVICIVSAAAEHNQSVIVSDKLLQDALNAQVMSADINTMHEVNQSFFDSITIPFHGARMKIAEIATMISAAARMGKAASAISALLGDVSTQDKVVQYWGEYRREMEAALEWCKQHEKDINNRGVSIVHLKDFAASYMTGSIAAHLAKLLPQSLVLVMAYAPDKRIRVSLRSSGHESNILHLLAKIFEGMDCEYGGSAYAAGGTFSRAEEENFLSAARKVLEKAFVEEKV